MKTVTIKQEQFCAAMNAVKHAVAKGTDRLYMQYIKVVVAADSVTFYALDGYRAAKVTIKQENECEFECLIKPIEIKKPRRSNESYTTTISYDEENKATNLTLEMECGAITYRFNPPPASFIDIKNIYDNARKHDRELAVNASYITDAAKAIAATSGDNKHKTVVFETKENPCAPFILRSEGAAIINEQLILPIRIAK